MRGLLIFHEKGWALRPILQCYIKPEPFFNFNIFNNVLFITKKLEFLNITSYSIMIFCSVATKHTMKDEPQKSTKSSVSSKERYRVKQKGYISFFSLVNLFLRLTFFFKWLKKNISYISFIALKSETI